MARRPKGWHRETIKAELRKRVGPITHLSEAWGFHRSAITNCLASARYSQPLELRIAEALKVPPCVLWPSRWDRSGNPLPRVVGQNDNAGAVAKSRQNGAAA